MSMASTSKQVASSCFPSSSSTPHDVFLSFRGTDTRNNFTSHLYTALKDAGIKTFIDDELPMGKEIKPELRKAIRESRMSIIVFSKNYASSRWCLDELVEILECMRTMGQLVLPLFYDVEPSVVRYQTGSYAKAFQYFVAEWDKPKVKLWRAVLKEAADLSGHVLANEEDGNEARFIEKIVRKVQPEVNFRFLNVPESLVSGYSNFNCINTLLSIGSDDVRTIGIFGMGGIGKTTVSKDVYNKYLNDFEGSAFVENIKDVSKLPDGLCRLQKNLLSQLQKKKTIKPKNSVEGIDLIKKFCCSRRVLILLDDLDDLNQVNQLAGHKSWFRIGSRVIMITRDAKLLKEAQVDHDHIYEMKVLDEDKSLELFRWHAIGEETPSEDHISLSIDIARYCGGLPLALEVIGSHLRQENLTYWTNALKEFQSKPLKKIQDQLKISYDALSKDRKKIFLDIACFFIGWKTEYLVKFWDGCGFFAENSIRDLMDKCLLKFDENNCLWMHDHLRDMGRAIVVEESDSELKMPSRLWTHQQVRDLLQLPEGAEVVEGICLYLSYSQSIDLNTKAFEAMHQLRFLQIKKVDVIGSFEHSFRKLRWFSWQNCPLKSLPSNFHPRELVVLDMQWSAISKLWEGVKHLNNLKILDLSYCDSLVETPNFTGIRSLEHLVLRYCKRLSTIDPSICELKSLKTLNASRTGLEGLPDSIGQLSRLIHLRLEWCEELKTLPATICNLISLEELDVSGYSKLERLPEELGNMKSLKTLNVSRTWLEGLPDSIGQLSRLVHLCLKWCTWRLKTLPTTICNLRSLEELDVSGCSNLERLPEELGNMKSLKTLNVSATLLEGLPDSIGQLSRLVHLRLEWCKELKTLPTTICNLIALEELDVSSYSKLERLPEELGNMKSLKTLNVSRTGLEGLSDSIGQLSRLVHLRLESCQELKTLPTTICNLISLEELDISGCSKLERLPEELGNMKSLKTLNASRTGLEGLPDSIGQLSRLVNLCLESCKELKTLPTTICNLRSLEKLYVFRCSKLERLPEELGNLECLLDLDLRWCKNLINLPPSTCNMTSLEKLDVGGCSNLKRLPERMGNLKRLRTLNASKTGLEELPDSIGHLSSLVHLHLSKCRNLRTLPDCICDLSSLKVLNINSYSRLQQLPDRLGNMVSLRNLDANNCKSLVSLPELPSNLEILCASGCTAMEKIPNLSNLKRLWRLDLLDSNRLVEVQGLETLKLTFLDMRGCNDLAMNTTFNESFFRRYFERGEYSSILLPKWNFQNWIIYQSMESTISFELPPSLPDNFQGIILWVVYAHFSDDSYSADITNNTSGKEWNHNEFSETYCSGGQSWVSCIKSNFRSGDSIKISIEEFDYEYEYAKVEKCGVHWFIGSEGDEDENVHYCNTPAYDYDYDYDDYDYDEERLETERVYDDHNPTETERGVNLKRGHDFDLNTEPNEETERVYYVNLKRGHDFDLNTDPNEESSKRLRS